MEVSPSLSMKAAFLTQVPWEEAPLSTRLQYDVPKGRVSCLIRAEPWGVNSSQWGKLKAGMEKRPQEVSRNQATSCCVFWFTEQVCGASVPWTQAKCL